MVCGHVGKQCFGGMYPRNCQSGDLAPDAVRLLKQIVTTGNPARVEDLAAEFDRRRAGVRTGTVLMREWNRQLQANPGAWLR
jgi:hypothetical protein